MSEKPLKREDLLRAGEVALDMAVKRLQEDTRLAPRR